MHGQRDATRRGGADRTTPALRGALRRLGAALGAAALFLNCAPASHGSAEVAGEAVPVEGFAPAAASAGPAVGLEVGRASASRLDVRIPSSTGTRISLVDELDTEDATYVRIRTQAVLGDRHVVALTVAPLRFESSGATRRDVLFDRYLFPAGTDVRATYRFDSYRLTYRYALVPVGRLRLAVGATAFVRDAEVLLESEWGSARSSNTGLVPLLSAELQWLLAPRFALLADGDAMAAPQGRAVDLLLAGRYRAADRLDLHAGYRLLEGGSDGDEVYTFALAHLWNVGATLRF